MVVKQYRDLFDQTQEMINSHAPEVMNARRVVAAALLKEGGIPTKRMEAYQHTDIQAMFALNYGLNLNRHEMKINPYEVFKCEVPNMSTHLLFMMNDGFYDKHAPIATLAEGVFAGSLKKFAENYPEITERYYDKLASAKADGPTAINTLFAQDGFVLYVPKGVVMEKPIQLVNILRSEADFMVNRRVLIIVEKMAQAKLLMCDHAMNDKIYLANQVAEIFVEEGAHLDYYELEENSRNTNRVCSTFLHQEANSHLLTNSITLTNGRTRNNFYTCFAGENAELHLSGIAIADCDQHVDTFSHIDHAVPNCSSNELFKYVLDGNAVGAFAGRILVREGAQHTAAMQSNKNIVMTDSAKMYTRPELEIYADDVKCSHGATVGQLDEKALFYMRARGIGEKEARMLLMYAFASDVIDQISLEPLRDRIRLLVERRFKGEIGKCKTCESACK